MNEKKKTAGRVWADGDGDEFHALAARKVPPTRSAAIVVTSGLGVYLTAAQCREVAAHFTALADAHEEAMSQSAPALPTEPGAVIVPADGRADVDAVYVGSAYTTRHATYDHCTGAWVGLWRHGAGGGCMSMMAADHITPGTWKVDDQ